MRTGSVREWLGFGRAPDWTKARTLGRVIGCAILLLAIVVIVTAIAGLLRMVGIMVSSGGDMGDSPVRDLGLFLGAVIGAPFLVWRTLSLDRQAKTGDATLLNERISSAAEGLSARMEVTVPDGERWREDWAPDGTQRIVAIDTLQGIAQERPELAPRIVRMLAAFVRMNFPRTSVESRELSSGIAVPAMELQAAISAIGMVLKLAQETDPSEWRLGLQDCNFDGVQFARGHFRAVDFSGSRFERTVFDRTNFDGAIFNRSTISYCWFRENIMTGVRFIDAKIVDGAETPIYPIIHDGAKGLNFLGADLTGLIEIDENTFEETFGSSETKLPKRCEHLRPNASDIRDFNELNRKKSKGALDSFDEGHLRVLEPIIAQNLFEHWSSYDRQDLRTVPLMKKFYEAVDLYRWPYMGD